MNRWRRIARAVRDRRVVVGVVGSAVALVLVTVLLQSGEVGREESAGDSTVLQKAPTTAAPIMDDVAPSSTIEASTPPVASEVEVVGQVVETTVRSRAPATARGAAVAATTATVVSEVDGGSTSTTEGPAPKAAVNPRGFLSRYADGLWWVAADGSERGLIVAASLEPGERDIGGAAWAPDRSGVVYTASSDRSPSKYGESLYWSDISGGGRRVVLAYSGSCTSGGHCRLLDPAVSPDGKSVVLVRESMYFNDGVIVTVPTAGGAPTAVTKPTERGYQADRSPTWSPDGQQIIFASNRESTGNVLKLYRVNVDGTGLTQLPAFGEAREPRWSPDGRLVAFISDRNGNSDLFVANPDGSEIRQLTTDPEADEPPVWSSDSRTIAYYHSGRGYRFVNVDGSAASESQIRDWR